MTSKSEIQEVVRSIEIISSTQFIYKGQLLDERYLGDGLYGTNEHLRLQIRDIIYRMYHCRQPFSVYNSIVHNSNYFASYYNDIMESIASLSEANCGSGTWSGSWQILRFENTNQLTVYKDGLTLWIDRNGFSPYGDKMDIGSKGSIKILKGMSRMLPGYYMAFSNAPIDDNNGIIVRLYWNIKKVHVCKLMKLVTDELNTAGIPFRFKVLSNPYEFPRSDAAVLYINKTYLNRITNYIFEIYKQTMMFVNPTTSIFAKKLAPGLAFAEEIQNDSFGRHRSYMIAETLYDLYSKGISAVTEKISAVSDRFLQSGLNIDKPYLNSGSVDDYDTIFGVFAK